MFGQRPVCLIDVAVEFVVAFESRAKDRQVQNRVVEVVEEGLAFKGVKEEEVLGSSAESGVVLFEKNDGSELHEKGAFRWVRSERESV